jgi:predicted nucleotidyltransferase
MVDQSVIETAKRFIRQIPADFRLKKAFLFGSYAKGSQNIDSDIDIALVLENMNDFFSMQRLLMQLRRKIDLRIEPHPISTENFTNANPFVSEIQKSGVEINLEG